MNGSNLLFAFYVLFPVYSAVGQTVLTSVTTQTYALLYGTKAVYQDFPESKATINEIDIVSKDKRVLLPEAQGGGVPPYYFDYGWSGNDLAYVTFSTRPEYPLDYMDVSTKAKKAVTADKGWKESVWVGGGAVVWVDYRHKTSGDKNGEIYLYTVAGGTEKRVTASATYQGKPVTDGKHIAWLDYSESTVGNVVLYDIATGGTSKPSPSSSHQDNPRVDGDWVIWEDYRNAKTDTANADLFAYNLATKVVIPLCVLPGYQGKPFLQGAGVVWDDYRNVSGGDKNVDLYGYDLAAGKEVVISTKAGYETSPVVYGNKVVWFATEGANMLIYAGNVPLGSSGIRNRWYPLGMKPEAMDQLFRLDGRWAGHAAGKGAGFTVVIY